MHLFYTRNKESTSFLKRISLKMLTLKSNDVSTVWRSFSSWNVSKKIKGHFKPKEHKPPIVNQQNIVYYYKCGLCNTDYVGFTSRHLHQRVEEHKRATIGYYVKEEHDGDPDSIGSNFEILKKCQSKLDCLIFEMLFIRKLKPKLNKQSDSIRAKLFT